MFRSSKSSKSSLVGPSQNKVNIEMRVKDSEMEVE